MAFKLKEKKKFELPQQAKSEPKKEDALKAAAKRRLERKKK